MEEPEAQQLVAVPQRVTLFPLDAVELRAPEDVRRALGMDLWYTARDVANPDRRLAGLLRAADLLLVGG